MLKKKKLWSSERRVTTQNEVVENRACGSRTKERGEAGSFISSYFWRSILHWIECVYIGRLILDTGPWLLRFARDVRGASAQEESSMAAKKGFKKDLDQKRS